MNAAPNESYTKNPAIREIANSLRLSGAIGFWVQLALAGVSSLSLLFALFGRNVSEETLQGIGIAIFFGVCGILTLLFSVFVDFRYTRVGKSLINPRSRLPISKADTIALLRLGVIASLIGISLSLLGAGFGIAVQIAKVVSQPPGVAITEPSNIVRALDVLVVTANVNSIAAHFIGALISLWLIDRINR
jgi:hypothetical protein